MVALYQLAITAGIMLAFWLNYLVEAVGSDMFSAQKKKKPLDAFSVVKAITASQDRKLKLKQPGV